MLSKKVAFLIWLKSWVLWQKSAESSNEREKKMLEVITETWMSPVSPKRYRAFVDWAGKHILSEQALIHSERFGINYHVAREFQICKINTLYWEKFCVLWGFNTLSLFNRIWHEVFVFANEKLNFWKSLCSSKSVKEMRELK